MNKNLMLYWFSTSWNKCFIQKLIIAVFISVRKGWAIDQIKFEYDDNKTWAHGIDGGR